MTTNTKTNFEAKTSAFENDNLKKRYSFSIGIYLSLLSMFILVLLVVVRMPVTVQQALAVIAGLVILNALDAFKRCLEDTKPDASSILSGNTYHIYNEYATHANTYNTYNEKQDLKQAAIEIQQLLDHLSQTYPITTEHEKIVLAEEVVEEIENNPPLEARVVSALKAGSAAALEELINHPINKLLIAVLEGWLATKETERKSRIVD